MIMRYCFDLDGTLCTMSKEVDDLPEGPNKDHCQIGRTQPIQSRIDIVNDLYDGGNYIIIETARGTVTGLDWYEKTQSQLDEWGLKYHELRTGTKISADIYIDDKGKNSEDFFKRGDY